MYMQSPHHTAGCNYCTIQHPMGGIEWSDSMAVKEVVSSYNTIRLYPSFFFFNHKNVPIYKTNVKNGLKIG